MKYFSPERVRSASIHLSSYESKWVIVPLVLAVNGVGGQEDVKVQGVGKAGTDGFLKNHFAGHLLGIQYGGGNSLRPLFDDIDPKNGNYVVPSKQHLWGNAYSSRGYREMQMRGNLLMPKTSVFRLPPAFQGAFEKQLPKKFRFEELLVWLYAFSGFPDNIHSWDALYLDFQERYLGVGGRFPKEYSGRFRISGDVPWPKDQILSVKPTADEFRNILVPAGVPSEDDDDVDYNEPSITETVLGSEIEPEDNVYQTVLQLREDGYAGVILRGPPGTSKSWYALRIASKLVGDDPLMMRALQFHHSYQYEDFVEGFVPADAGGFQLRPKHLVQICRTASETQDALCVLVIDELSRTDPSRVFGEALTYLESDKRGQTFHLASGTSLAIPKNLFVIATMNTHDRGADDVDAAFERRFAFVNMPPSSKLLNDILEQNGIDVGLKERVLDFFNQLQAHQNPSLHIGHAYFRPAKDLPSLERLWNHQLSFILEKAVGGQRREVELLHASWKAVIASDENP
jgi:5-methylcytosine-specific restriction enzyme B